MTGEADTRASATLFLSDVRRAYSPRPRAVRARISRAAGAVLFLAASVVIVGWLADASTLTRIVPTFASMKMNTAVCFALLGIAFWLPGGVRDPRAGRLTGRLAAALVTAIATLTLAQYLFAFDLHIDRLLFWHAEDQGEFPGRMSSATAAGLFMIGLAAVLVDWRTKSGNRPSLLLAIIVATIGLTAAIGHLYDARSLYAMDIFSSMALHTSLLFLIAAVGILGVHPDSGPFGILASDGRGSRLARAIMPVAIVLPVAIGWLRLQGEHAGYYDLEFGLALFATASALVFITLIWVTATSLNREEAVKRRADEVLQLEAIRRRILVEQATDGIFVVDPDYRIVEANRSLATMIGCSLAELVDMQPWDWIHDEATREWFASDQSSPGTTHETFESQLRRVDGAIIDAEISCSIANVDDQRFLLFVCRDISERKRSQIALRSSEQRFRRALENIPDVVVIYDADLRIQYVNQGNRAVLGQSADFFIGKQDDDFLPRSETQKYLPVLQKVLQTRQITTFNVDLDLPTVGVRALRITYVPLTDQEGQIREVLAIGRDLTERKRADTALRSSEAKHRNLIEQAADGIFICDSDGNFELVNSRCCELLGYREQELLGLNGKVTFLSEETSVDTNRLRALTSGRNVRYERMLRRKDGTVFPAEVSVKLLDWGSTQVIFHDITERHEQERKIARLHRIQAMRSGINSAIVRIRDRSELLQEVTRIAVAEGNFCVGWIGTFDHSNQRTRMAAQCGFPDSDAISVVDQLVPLVPEGPAAFAIYQQRPVFDNDIVRAASASRGRQLAVAQGAQSVIALPLVVESEPYGIVVLYAREKSFFDDEEIKLLRELADDVSFGLEFIAKEERVDYLAYYDATTGLPNQNLFFQHLSRQLQGAANDGLGTTLSLIDIDRFRMINETFGRDEGDTLIASIAERISQSVDEHSIVARIGSNTFAVAVSEKGDVAKMARHLEVRGKAVFEKAFQVGGEELRMSATTGVAIYPADGDVPEVLFANAEAALRSAKSGNHRYLLYSRDMNARVAELMRLENKVRGAIENKELTLWYQPKVCAQTGKLRGLEALMRWHDPDTGKMIPPHNFIPVLEHTGLILDAGEWALGRVARDCKAWKAAGVGAPPVAVNVSPIQLEQQNFVDVVVDAHAAIARTGAELELEITESVIMEQVDKIIPKLQTLHGLGIRISIDDFGTGYSSLHYIAKLPIDVLKIDRSFVFGLGDSAESLAIVKAIISLAKALQLVVVAEGVETAAQGSILRDLECDELQGYHFSRPLPADEIVELIRSLS